MYVSEYYVQHKKAIKFFQGREKARERRKHIIFLWSIANVLFFMSEFCVVSLKGKVYDLLKEIKVVHPHTLKLNWTLSFRYWKVLLIIISETISKSNYM